MCIAQNQFPAAPRSRTNSIAGTAARFDPYEVVAQALKLVFNTAGPRISNRNHTNKRAHADGYPQNGKPTANPIAIQGSEGLAKNGLEIHLFWSGPGALDSTIALAMSCPSLRVLAP